MSTPAYLQSLSPASVLLVAFIFGVVYLFISVLAFSQGRTAVADGSSARLFKKDLWWPFRPAEFDAAGQRLCALGKALFVIIVLLLVVWAWLTLKVLLAGK